MNIISFYLGQVWWIAWSIMSISVNLFMVLVFCIHLIRAILTRLELVSTFASDDNSLFRQSWHFWNYTEAKECFNTLILILWTKATNFIIAWKSDYRLNVERPKSTPLFGLCALYFVLIFVISISCTSFCEEVDCLNVIGLWNICFWNFWVGKVTRVWGRLSFLSMAYSRSFSYRHPACRDKRIWCHEILFRPTPSVYQPFVPLRDLHYHPEIFWNNFWVSFSMFWSQEKILFHIWKFQNNILTTGNTAFEV